MTTGERADGLQTFAALVEEFAVSAPTLPVQQIVRRLRRTVQVAVDGRSGVGRSTVAAALGRRGVAIAPDTAHADVRVVVIAEGPKPEDRLTSVTLPTLVVLNKADLIGSAGTGAMANALRRAADVTALTGAPTVPTVGLLAMAADVVLDEEMVDALRAMVNVPVDLSSVDVFVAADHPVSSGTRQRLLATLDRFGVAHAIVALASGADPDQLPTLFAEVSNVAAVLAGLRAVAAPLRYGRVRSAAIELRSLAVQFDDQRLHELVSSDAVVLAAMTAAVEVLEATGMTVDASDDAPAHRHRARRWRQHGSGPVNALHRNCSADVVRGSLRLLDGIGR